MNLLPFSIKNKFYKKKCMKASDTDIEVSEVTKKKHVTLDDRPSSRSNTPKMTSSSTVNDIRNRYYEQFSLLSFLIRNL